MRLEDIAIVLRRRTPWEALDLGQVMLRQWRPPLLRAWAATYLPVALLLFLVLWGHPDLAAILLWWIKPAFDRVLLFVYSRALFGAAPGVREVWRELPRMLGRSGLVAGLTLHRFSMARSFFLPVWQLERLRGREARARRRVLGARSRSYAVWLTFFLANLSAVLAISVILVLQFLAPVDSASLFDWSAWLQGEQERWREFLFYSAVVAAETVIEPLYVGAGFSLYLNRRTELEGWDIELAFRRMAANAARPTQARPQGSLAALLCAAVVCIALPDPAAAGDDATPAAGRDSAAKLLIREVLDDPVFGRKTQTHDWRYRRQEQDGTDPEWLKPFRAVAEFIAASLRLLVYLGWALAAALLIYLFYRYRDAWRGVRVERPAPPATLFGLDVRPESLPEDVAAEARAHLAAGRFAAALSLLYRGALAALIHRAHVEFRSGDTEDDCRQRVAGRIDAAGMECFERLLRAWRLTAYAHTPPPQEELHRLCDAWDAHFSLRAGAS